MNEVVTFAPVMATPQLFKASIWRSNLGRDLRRRAATASAVRGPTALNSAVQPGSQARPWGRYGVSRDIGFCPVAVAKPAG